MWRKIQSSGLTNEYNKKEGGWLLMRKMMALAFLPAEHITPVIDEIMVQKHTAMVYSTADELW